MEKSLRPIKLFRCWKQAAGPIFGRFVPAAPFSALATFGWPTLPPLFYDEACQELATNLRQTLEGEAVSAGEAAFVIDLPGPISLGLGFYLQQLGISPILLFGGLWRPAALLEGAESASSLAYYSERLNRAEIKKGRGYAFLLERERFQEVAPLSLVKTFNNRYRAGLGLFPPPPELRKAGLAGLIDLRVADDELPDDLMEFYNSASQAGLDIFQSVVNQI